MAQITFFRDRSRILTNILTAVLVAVVVGVLVWTFKPSPDSTDLPRYGLVKGSDKVQVGFITVGPTSDWGYNYQHNEGRLAMEAKLRDRVHTVLAENIPETAEAERVMQRMIDEGADHGLQLSGYSTQREFLVDLGLLELMEPLAMRQDASSIRRLQALKNLLLPPMMGERFKVLLQRKGVGGGSLPGFRKDAAEA